MGGRRDDAGGRPPRRRRQTGVAPARPATARTAHGVTGRAQAITRVVVGFLIQVPEPLYPAGVVRNTRVGHVAGAQAAGNGQLNRAVQFSAFHTALSRPRGTGEKPAVRPPTAAAGTKNDLTQRRFAATGRLITHVHGMLGSSGQLIEGLVPTGGHETPGSGRRVLAGLTMPASSRRPSRASSHCS